jgi:hypothetical protein
VKLPPELEAKVLAGATHVNGVAVATAERAKPAKVRRKPPEMVPGGFGRPGTFWVPLVTASEANARNWKERSARTHAARRAVSRVLGPHLRALADFSEHYHAGGALRVVFTRLGGRRLDRSNLGNALKATEDAVCLVLGCDDGDPRWVSSFEQEPGGKVGVRVELEALEAK